MGGGSGNAVAKTRPQVLMLPPNKPHDGIITTLVLLLMAYLHTLHGTRTEEQGKVLVQEQTLDPCSYIGSFLHHIVLLNMRGLRID